MRAADHTTLVDKAAAAKTELESNRVAIMAACALQQARGEGGGKEEQAGDTGGSAPSELARALEVVEVEGRGGLCRRSERSCCGGCPGR